MRNYMFIISVFLLFSNASFGQNTEGTYIGSHLNGKMVAFIKNTNGVVFGYFYENKNRYHVLTGLSINNEISGKMTLSGLKEFECEGVFRNDSVFIFLNEIGIEHFMTIALKKVNNKTKVNLEKYFTDEKPANDPRLIGEWLLISDFDIKTQQMRPKNEFTSLVLDKGGFFQIKGYTGVYPNIITTWYTQGSFLCCNFKSTMSSSDLNQGKYIINGDSLTTSGERDILKYVKKK